ncbi:hypothetical protein PJ906_004409 [Escherichia coli]|nr:hypothetical protein [Escherichia coli]EKK0607336.1 hypothetical protein [Escherichia coli]
MSDITNRLDTDMRSRVSSYRDLAEKAVYRTDYSQNGIVDALERFFHKLEFLLKYGYLPSTDDADANGKCLPPELQGLQTFLENGETKGSYVLQRNDMERYRFSWQSSEKLTVTVEQLHTSIAAVRSGYNNRSTAGWYASTAPQECGVSGLLSLLKEVPYNKPQCMSYKEFCAKYNSENRLPTSSNPHTISINREMNKDDCLDAYRKIVEKVSDRPCSYHIPAPHLDNKPIFNTCLVDICRAHGTPLSLGGVKISENTFKKIISRIMPDYESKASSVVNTSAFTAEEVREILSTEEIERILSTEEIERILSTEAFHDFTSDEKKAIRDILQNPQFPLALLAVVCQGLNAGDVMAPILMNQVDVQCYLQGCSLNHIINANDFLFCSFSIKSDEMGGLLCESTLCMPCLVDGNKIGVSKACNMFPVTENLGRGKTEHSASEVENMLATLNSAISTAITI